MSAEAPDGAACPRCAAPLAPDQDWCLSCGAAARTRLVPTPNWRLPLGLLATLALAAGIALAVAFASLTDDGPAVVPTTTAPAATPTATTPPAATPPATTTAPTAPATPTRQPDATTPEPDAGAAQPDATTTAPGG